MKHIQPLLVVSLLLITLSACSSATVTTNGIDPDTKTTQSCTASYYALFHSTEKINMSACNAKGSATKADSTQASSVLADALLKGLGLVPK